MLSLHGGDGRPIGGPDFVAPGIGHKPMGEEPNAMTFILWLIAVVLVIWGIVTLVRGGVLLGIVLIVVGLLVGPGGVSIFSK